MRIAYAAIDGGTDYRKRALRDPTSRLEDLVATVEALRKESVDLLVFPAGYFQVRDRSAREALQRRLEKRLKKTAPRFGIVVGFDEGSATKQDRKVASKRGLPYFALYRNSSGGRVWMQQVSVNSRDGADRELIDRRWRNRAVVLPSTKVAFLICGECWSNELLNNEVFSSGCKAIIIAAHRNVNMHREKTGYGRLSWHRRLDSYAKRHAKLIVLSEHTRSPMRHHYAWPASRSSVPALVNVPTPVTLRFATF
jgi:hypothetical protein